MRYRLALCGSALIAVFAGYVSADAHEEDLRTSSAQRFDVSKGKTPVGSRYRLFAQKAAVSGLHLHLGSGRQICLTLKHRGYYRTICDDPRSSTGSVTMNATGWACEPDWSRAYGTVTAKVSAVRVTFANGRRKNARLVNSPDDLHFDQRFFVTMIRRSSWAKRITAYDSSGEVLERQEVQPRGPVPRSCDD